MEYTEYSIYTIEYIVYIYIAGIDGKSIEVKKAYEIENTASQPVCYVVGITKGNM